MTVTYTTRVGLSKADLGDLSGSWQTIWNQDADRAEARLAAVYAGNPHGNLAGYYVGQTCVDTTNGKIYRCTVADGTAGGSTWVVVDDLTTLVAQGKHALWIPATYMKPTITAGCAILSYYEPAANKPNIPYLAFDATTTEHAAFAFKMPKSWNEGTVTFKALWMSSGTDTDGMALGLKAVALSDGDAANTAFGTGVVVTDDLQSAAYKQLLSAESSAITIGGTPAENDVVYFDTYRDVADGNDDMAEDLLLIGLELFITTNAATDA